MKPTPVPLSDVDLTNLDYFVDNEAWGMFDTLRAEDPLHWQDEPDSDGHGFWSVTRYDDIEMVNKDGETFTSTKFVNLEEPPAEFQDLRRSILESDGTRHQALRKMLARDFSVAQLRRYEDFLRGLARESIDAALAQEDIDFVDADRADFPINVLARLLDVPDEMIPQLITWGNAIVGFSDPELSDVLVDSEEAQQYKHLPFRSPGVAGDLRVRTRSSPRSAGAVTATTSSASSSTASPRTASRSPTPTSTTTSCCSSSRATRRPGRP